MSNSIVSARRDNYIENARRASGVVMIVQVKTGYYNVFLVSKSKQTLIRT